MRETIIAVAVALLILYFLTKSTAGQWAVELRNLIKPAAAAANTIATPTATNPGPLYLGPPVRA